MKIYDLLVRGGRLATPGGVVDADIGVIDGRISAIGSDLGTARRTVDATGRLVLPGGVDAHCHLDQPSDDGSVMADDFASGSRSAVCGGTTTMIPFAIQFRGQTLDEAFEEYERRSKGKSVADFGFHMIVTDPTPDVLERDLPRLAARGVTSIKIYMTYDALKLNDRQMLDVLEAARRHGILPMIHAENADCIAWLTDRLLAAGRTAPAEHAVSRPAVAEREATHRAISFSELVDVPVLIVHVSGPDAIEQIRWAQQRGLKINGETCPQYLFLTAADLHRPGFDGARFICSPPPRDERSQHAVWEALQSGLFSVFSSDHAPYRYDDASGKKLHGEGAAFCCVPNGIPGLETRMPLLFSEGVLKGRLTLEQFIELTSAGPARLYGLYPRKGAIAVGADADLVLWDLGRKVAIRNDMLNHGCDYTPYEGFVVNAWPSTTLLRGEIVQQDGRVTARPGSGRFLKRATSGAFVRGVDNLASLMAPAAGHAVPKTAKPQSSKRELDLWQT